MRQNPWRRLMLGHFSADFTARIAADAAVNGLMRWRRNITIPISLLKSEKSCTEFGCCGRLWRNFSHRWENRGQLGDSASETRLHALASEIEPALQHKTYFRTKTRTELINDLTESCRMPGVSPIMTQPIRNRIDMLATGIQTPIGIKVFGTDLAKIEEDCGSH